MKFAYGFGLTVAFQLNRAFYGIIEMHAGRV
jgi:hypothetical protein